MEAPLWEEVAGWLCWLWGVGRNRVPQTVCSLCNRSSEAGKGQLQDLAPSWRQREGWVRALCMFWVLRAPLNSLDVTVPSAGTLPAQLLFWLPFDSARGQTRHGMDGVCERLLDSVLVCRGWGASCLSILSDCSSVLSPGLDPSAHSCEARDPRHGWPSLSPKGCC